MHTNRQLESSGRQTVTLKLQPLLLCLCWLLPLTANAQGRPEIVWMKGGHADWIRNAIFSPDGQWVVSAADGGFDNTIKVWRASDGALVHTLNGHGRGIASLAFSPDGQWLASSSTDGTIQVWRVADWSVLQSLDLIVHNGGFTWIPAVDSVDFAPAGNLLAAGSNRPNSSFTNSIGLVVLWLTSDWSEFWRRDHGLHVFTVDFSPDGQQIASGSDVGMIRFWQVSDGSLLRQLAAHRLELYSVAFSPQGTWLASGGRDTFVRVWNTADGTLLYAIPHPGSVRDVAFSPDGLLLASTGDGRTTGEGRYLWLWRAADGQLIRQLEGHTGNWVFSVAFSPDGQSLVSGGGFADNQLLLWRVGDGALLRRFTLYTASIHQVAFSPDGQKLAVVSGYNTGSGPRGVKTEIWSAEGALLQTFPESDVPRTVAFSPDGQLVATGNRDGRIRLWRVSDGALLQTLTGHTYWVRSVAFSPDGQLLASGGDRTVRLWRVSDGALLSTLEGHTATVHSVALSPDGRLLASGGEDSRVLLWRVEDGTLLHTFIIEDPGWAFSVAFSPDGQRLAVSVGGEWRRFVQLWRVADGALLYTLTGLTDAVSSLAFSPDGKTLMGGSSYFAYHGEILFWRVEDGSLLRRYDQEGGTWVSSVVFSPNGRLFAYGRSDATVVLARNPFWQVGDVNGNGCVEDTDLAAVLAALGTRGGGLWEDLNEDGIVDDQDLSLVLRYFGSGC